MVGKPHRLAAGKRSPRDARPAQQPLGSSPPERIPRPLEGCTGRQRWNRRTRAWGEDAGGVVNGWLTGQRYLVTTAVITAAKIAAAAAINVVFRPVRFALS